MKERYAIMEYIFAISGKHTYHVIIVDEEHIKGYTKPRYVGYVCGYGSIEDEDLQFFHSYDKVTFISKERFMAGML